MRYLLFKVLGGVFLFFLLIVGDIKASTNASNLTYRKIIIPERTDSQGTSIAPINIPLAPGVGVTINLSNLSEHIEDIWLDNPSFVTLDINGSLTNNLNPATIIHLRRIQDFSIEGLLKTNSTTMTVVTRKKNGKVGIYVFKLYKIKTSTLTLIELNPPATPPTPPVVKPRNLCGVTDISAEIAARRTNQMVVTLRRGIARAIKERLIRVNSPVIGRLTNYINLISCGIDVNIAAAQVGISTELVNKLMTMGSQQNQPTHPKSQTDRQVQEEEEEEKK